MSPRRTARTFRSPGLAHRMASQAWRELTGRGPLVRRCDTVYAWFAAALILLVVAGMAAVALIGRSAYGDAAARRERALATSYPVSATVLEKPRAAVPRSGAGSAAHALIGWTGPNGESHADVAPVSRASKTGGRVTIWLGADGRPVRPPLPPRAATENAIAAGGVAVAGLTALLLPAHLLGRARIEGLRDREWERAWRTWRPATGMP